MIEISTDGSVGRNRDGGWAFVAWDSDHETFDKVYGCESDTTISRMELLACIKALEWVIQTYDYAPRIRLITDSSYVRNCFKEKWWKKWEVNGWINSKGEPVANQDLWKRLFELRDCFNSLQWLHVKGHRGHYGNEEADRLAVMARKEKVSGSETDENDEPAHPVDA